MRAGAVSVGLVGEILRVGPRTLQRRLAAQGISYSELLEHVRFAEAERLLEATDLPVREIGLRLGYSGAPTFVRAFQRLAGVPPGAWRSSRRGG